MGVPLSGGRKTVCFDVPESGGALPAGQISLQLLDQVRFAPDRQQLLRHRPGRPEHPAPLAPDFPVAGDPASLGALLGGGGGAGEDRKDLLRPRLFRQRLVDDRQRDLHPLRRHGVCRIRAAEPFDHHRRGDEFPNKPLLTYIETSASSASELVSEFIQFQTNRKIRLPKFVPTLLLAGIYVDTKSFAVRTTGKTFDMASFLKTQGADIALVQYLLSSDLDSYLSISRLVARSDYYRKDIVVSVADEREVYDGVTVAKTADTLLSLNGIHASFVITKQAGGVIGISARSSGTINVQTIMEALGGGGHFTNAATQIKGKTLDEVQQELFQELDKLERTKE